MCGHFKLERLHSRDSFVRIDFFGSTAQVGSYISVGQRLSHLSILRETKVGKWKTRQKQTKQQ